MNKTFNIIIRGAWFENKGAEAMLRTVQRELTIRLKNINFYLLCPETNSQYANIAGITPIPPIESRLNKYIPGSIARGIKISKYLIKKLDLKRLIVSIGCIDSVYSYIESNEIINKIGAFDAVIDISGFGYGDPWGVTPINMTLQWIEVCQKKGISYIFLPQCWGGFETKGLASSTKIMLEKATLYYARDRVSQSHLVNLLGKEQGEIPLMPDLVFKFKGANSTVAKSILCQMGCSIDINPIIGFSPNLNVYNRTKGNGLANEYIQLLIRLCNHCIEKFGASIVLVPNFIKFPNDINKDDRFLCGIIQSAIKNQDSCFVLTGNLSAETIKSVIGYFDLLVGSRFHTIVFGLSQSIPSIALSWSHKYRELLNYFGLDNFVCEYNQFNIEEVLHMLDRAWDERETNKKAIKKKLPYILKDVDTMFDQVANLINQSTH